MEKTIRGMEKDNALKTVREKSKRTIKPAPFIRTPFKNTNPAIVVPKKVNQPMVLGGHGYDPFEPANMQKVKVLDDWLQLDE
ncbi:unnamed protein product [Arabis nemorensis]|uniref:Uncharacterized protein n=1 Tax=Arabis nemorensis TaxID=586526 RepID=A0A565B9P0_9BRAS|nr:unnamed protein product [Arabis nemorensis]